MYIFQNSLKNMVMKSVNLQQVVSRDQISQTLSYRTEQIKKIILKDNAIIFDLNMQLYMIFNQKR